MLAGEEVESTILPVKKIKTLSNCIQCIASSRYIHG